MVDDDPLFRQVVSDVLSSKGHSLVAVDNATRALEEAARRDFDLVITDLVMPGVDGLSLVARLREKNPHQEVILLSGREDRKVASTARRAGVAEYLTKPIDDADLMLSVERCLQRADLRRECVRLRDENLEFARFQSINRHCLDFLSNPDLEWLQERILADVSGLCDAQSAALWVAGDRPGLWLKGYRGLVSRSALPERVELRLTGDTSDELSARLQQGVPWVAFEGTSPTLYVPLVTSAETIGLAQFSDPLSGEFREDFLQGARLLGEFAALGLKNARRFAGLQRQGLRDRDTSAYNLSYFTDYASKEIDKARRYGRGFSLISLSIDHLSQARQRAGAAAARAAARAVVRAISQRVRDSDVLAKANDQELYLLLPETDFFGATLFLRSALVAIAAEPEVLELEARVPLGITGGAASFPHDGEDFDELLKRCHARADDRRVSLERKLGLERLPFWDEVELLLGSVRSPPLPVDERSQPSRRGQVAEGLFEALQRELVEELGRDPQGRGVLYLGVGELRAELPIVSGLQALSSPVASRVFLLGRRGNLEEARGVTPVFIEGDEQLSRHRFLLWLSQASAYALLERPGKGASWAFHTSDASVVEQLIWKLQGAYELQAGGPA